MVAQRMVAQRQRGFTIVEVLVVIGIIAVLASLLFVGLRSALSTANKTRELNSLRNVSLGWTMYAGANSDHLMPGYIEPAVQDTWRLEWRNVRGEVLPAELAAPYTWRLAPYVEYSWEVLVGYRDDGQRELNATPEADVAFEPAFGYNALYVGGWWEEATVGATTFPAMRYDLISDPAYRGMVVRTMGSMQQPDNLVIFAASTEQQPGRFVNSDRGAGVPGFHLASPRIVANETRWQPADGFNNAIDVLVAGPVPNIRHTNSVAVATGDGGVSTLSFDQLADQRRWINSAQGPDWSHPE